MRKRISGTECIAVLGFGDRFDGCRPTLLRRAARAARSGAPRGRDGELRIPRDLPGRPDRTLEGHVQSFAPGSGQQFSLLPPDNATGNFTKVVQRIAVKILIDNAEGLTDRLRPGMSVVATVETREDGKR